MAARDEIQTLMEQAVAAFNKGDPVPFLNALDDDLEVFDHAPYRFDSKASFLSYLQGAMAGAESFSVVYHQPSYRTFNENVGVMNAYDMITIVPKGGAPQVQNNRSTYVYVKKGGQWKIVSAHFSLLPHA